METKTPKPATTIYQIAQRAGVSTSTVARALNGKSKEKYKRSASRAERIRHIAEQMGYRPNWRAKAFAEGKTLSVGLLQPKWWELFNGVNSTIVEGFVTELYKHRYQVLLVPVSEDNEWRRTLVEQRVDGCAMLQQVGAADEVLDTISQYDIPSVLINNDHGNGKVSSVLIDDYMGAVLAARHLKLLGHKRIGFYVNTAAEDHYSIYDRIRGFKDELGIDPHDDSMVWRSDDETILSRLVTVDSERPTAMICYSHFEAIPMLHNLSRFGIKVPQDLSVLCFNDIYPAQYQNPPLTAVTYDTLKMGRVAAQVLIRQIRDGWDGVARDPIVLKQHLVVRDSTGPVPVDP